MQNATMIRASVMVCAVALAMMAGCEKGSTPTPPATNESASTSNGLPAGFILASLPDHAVDVAAAKDGIAAGDEIAIRGRIGGSGEPFVDGRAAFTIVDKSLKACSDIPGDQCQQPWDYCCEPKESLARHSATIMVVSADGKTLPMGLQGVSGLKELSDVVVVGKVAQAEGNILLVHATGVYIAAQ